MSLYLSISPSKVEPQTNSPIENEQQITPSPIRNVKKSKHKSKKEKSPEFKQVSKKSSKREVKEISTIVEVNTQVHERCTKRSDKKKKDTYLSKHNLSSEHNESDDKHVEPFQRKQKKKKKRPDRALEMLDEEILEIIAKDYPKLEKGLHDTK